MTIDDKINKIKELFDLAGYKIYRFYHNDTVVRLYVMDKKNDTYLLTDFFYYPEKRGIKEFSNNVFICYYKYDKFVERQIDYFENIIENILNKDNAESKDSNIEKLNALSEKLKEIKENLNNIKQYCEYNKERRN